MSPRARRSYRDVRTARRSSYFQFLIIGTSLVDLLWTVSGSFIFLLGGDQRTLAWVLMLLLNFRLLEKVTPRSFSLSRSPINSSDSGKWLLPDLLNSIILHLSTLKSMRHLFDHTERASSSWWSRARLLLRIGAISLMSSAKSLTRWYIWRTEGVRERYHEELHSTRSPSLLCAVR